MVSKAVIAVLYWRAAQTIERAISRLPLGEDQSTLGAKRDGKIPVILI